MTWVAATKEVVEREVSRERENLLPETLALLDRYGVDPYPAILDRFGGERAFVVARSASHVVYFDDIESDFGTAREVDGRLVDCAMYGPLVLAVRVLHFELS